MKHYTVNGNDYEIGTQIGKILQKGIRGAEAVGNRLLADKTVAEQFAALKMKLLDAYPQAMQNVYGRADSAGVDRDAYLMTMCSEIIEGAAEHCTDILVKVSVDECILGHNEDGEYSTDNAALIKYEYDDHFVFDYTAVDALAGVSITFNSYGIVITDNYIYMPEKNPLDIPVWFVLNELIHTKSIDEILSALDGRSFASGFNLNVADSNTSRLYSIEGKLGQIDCIEITDRYAHSNHFTHPCFDEFYTPDDGTTLFRLEKSKEFLNRLDIAKATENDIYNILMHHGESPYNSIFCVKERLDNLTACTLLYNSKKRIATMHDHLNGTVAEFTI
jgi:hypothetical protein